MFYCKQCAEELSYPESMSKSFGICEICNVPAQCNDVPSGSLPKPEISKENMIRRIEIYSSIYILFLKKLPSKKIFDRFFNYRLGTDDEGSSVMQDFVSDNLKKEFHWSTAIGIMEAVEHIVDEAVSNGNIKKFEN